MSIVARGLGGRLVTKGYGGPLIPVVVVVSIPDTTFENVYLFLYQQNSYTPVAIYLGDDWKEFLASAGGAVMDTYFTVKKRYLDSNEEALIDKIGTFDGENILVNLAVSDTNVPVRKGYRWQLQVRDTDGETVKVPMSGSLDVNPILRKAI